MGLKIADLQARVGKKAVLRGVSLVVKPGEVVAIMGPNGSGKSSLAYSLMGHPSYKIKSGKIKLDGEDLLGKKTDERAKEGLFLGWQGPVGVRGVAVEQLLRAAVINCHNVACKRTGQEERCLTVSEFRRVLGLEAKKLKIKESLLSRQANVGFSGGEKKKLEVLQMAVLRPRYAILDEIDSGLDVDSLRLVGKRVKQIKKENPEMGLVLITHYRRILDYVQPDKVGVMMAGRIVKWGGKELVNRVEKEGYEGFK